MNRPFNFAAVPAAMSQLKGHKSVGGMRASIYNAMPIKGVQAPVDYLREFEKPKAEQAGLPYGAKPP